MSFRILDPCHCFCGLRSSASLSSIYFAAHIVMYRLHEFVGLFQYTYLGRVRAVGTVEDRTDATVAQQFAHADADKRWTCFMPRAGAAQLKRRGEPEPVPRDSSRGRP